MKLKDRASFFSFFLEKPLYEVCLIRIKEQVGEKRSTVGAHRYADYLLKTRPPNIANMLSIKNSSMLKISVSENFLVESRVVFYKIRCLFLAQGICIYVGHSFLMKRSWTNSLNVSFSLE